MFLFATILYAAYGIYYKVNYWGFSLSPKEKTIITMRYGLDGSDEKTQKEVADMLNISQSYIARIEKKILLRLKRDMNKLFL